jgi:DNA repair ATPase RecN
VNELERKMSCEYQGMRWLKCDLQVQTPEDARHWSDAASKLSEPRIPLKEGNPDESDIQDKARLYLRRCHEAGLDVIGVTDHNFSSRTKPREWFLVHLVEQNKAVARDVGRSPLTIFPGFEVDIGYHMLCLFPPARKQADVEECNTVLTKLGLPESARFSSGLPEQLRHNGQRVSLKKLIEIVQGEHGGIVIAAHADQNKGMFDDVANKNDYAHPDLYCVELTQNPPSQKHSDILFGKNQHWKRERFHPAWIMSSDAKSLEKDEHGAATSNSIGYRYTWIKMSQPSIESLRQAFLDHDSRIRVPEDTATDANPAAREQHARILALDIENAKFLRGHHICFSPSLNCVIGGRGSGKSTLLEGMRLAMGKDRSPRLDDKTKEKIERIRNLLNSSSETKVRVHWCSADGVEDSLVYSVESGGYGTAQIEGRDIPDLQSFFANLPVQFFSQQQLNQITSRTGNMLLSLLDDFGRNLLIELQQQETTIRNEIRQVLAASESKEQINKDIARITQELGELERQWKARASLQDEARRHQGLKAAGTYLKKVFESSRGDGERLVEMAQDIAESHSPLGSVTDKWVEGAWFKEKDDAVTAAKEQLSTDIAAAVEKYRDSIKQLFTSDEKWQGLVTEIKAADDAFATACREKGISPDDVSRIQEIGQSRIYKQQELEGKQKERDRLVLTTQRLPKLFAQLHKCWRDAYLVRKTIADEVEQSANSAERTVIKLNLIYFGDATSFFGIWNQLHSDRRTRLGKNWEEIGESILNAYWAEEKAEETAEQESDDENHYQFSIWEMLSRWLDAEKPVPDPVERALTVAQASIGDLKSLLHDTARDAWEQARVTRVEDAVDLVLFRADGSGEAGRVSDGSLSDGQRNTAALAMILAKGEFPLILDQPEDELDSNFIFRELVPMLRRLKGKRQIIVVTHNANLPVNGDAELVYALETKDGHGSKMAAGGLDRSDVTKAVLEIMEGSELAFQRRREKYHF